MDRIYVVTILFAPIPMVHSHVPVDLAFPELRHYALVCPSILPHMLYLLINNVQLLVAVRVDGQETCVNHVCTV